MVILILDLFYQKEKDTNGVLIQVGTGIGPVTFASQ